MLLNCPLFHATIPCCSLQVVFPRILGRVLLVLLAGWLPLQGSSQCMMTPIALGDQASASDLVIEGVVTKKDAFITDSGDFIYTTYVIAVTKVFKGTYRKATLTIIESGGVVGNRAIQVTPSIELQIGQVSTFFLKQFTFKNPEDGLRFHDPVYRAYASSQSVFEYDMYAKTVSGHFNQFDLEGWYDVMTHATGENYKQIKPLPHITTGGQRVAPAISSMSPLTITSGTFSTLTITGSGFGATMGASTVEFKNADNGGSGWIVATATHVQSWSNTQIQIRVPYVAGSGQVRVTVDGIPVTSTQSLTITYAQFNAEFNIGGTPTLFKRHLYSNNGIGGFTFRYHTEFNTNTLARKAFERALNSWRCATSVNFIIGDVTTTDVMLQDGVNVIRFDNGEEIPAGVGAQTYSYYDDCANISIYATHVMEIDMVFNDAFPGLTWEYGPPLPSGTEVDFESIALHELGHACALGHVISTPEVMHYSISNGESKRVLSANDIAGGNYIQAQNTGNPGYCGNSPMTNYRQVKYVNINTTGIESGDSWAQAYKRLQDALAAVTTCVDTIYVAAGTYYPDEGTGLVDNDQTLRFVLNSPVVLMGGYSATTGVRSLVSTPSILSGDINKNGASDPLNSQNVVRIAGPAHLDGFYIENGYADASAGEGKDGAGIYSIASGVVRNCVLRWNTAPGNPPNSVGRGGAFYQSSGTTSLVNVLLYSNAATGSGSVFHIDGGQVHCTNCTMASNSPSIVAVRIENGAHSFKNSIFWNNLGDLQIGSGSADVSYSMLQGSSLPAGVTGSNVLFNTNPLFVNQAGFNFELVPCSPAVSTGNNAYNSTSTDLLGNARLVGTIDRGAYENTSGTPTTVVTSTGNTGTGTLRTVLANCCTGNTITFSPSLNGQTIQLTSAITIDKTLNIHGPGINQLTIAGNGTHRIFSINTGLTNTIKDLSIINGDAGVSMGNVIQNGGTLTLQNLLLASEPNTMTGVTLSNIAGSVQFGGQVTLH